MEYEVNTEEPLPVAVVQAVSQVEDSPAEGLPPLAETINPDALDNLFRRGSSGSVSFTYSKSVVTVDHCELVTVEAETTT